jgi:hypothetical protein
VLTTKGKRMPLDVAPDERGNIVLEQVEGEVEEVAFVLAGERLSAARGVETLYTSHFATCPEADSWRKR